MKYIKDDKKQQIFIQKLLQKFKNPYVAVGILQDEPHDKHFSMVDLALVHEYGAKNIPARSFIRSTCDSKRKEHLNFIQKLEDKVLNGKISINQALSTLGEVVSKDMVESINHGISPALKPATIKRKKSSQALIDTGRLKGAITHEVRGL